MKKPKRHKRREADAYEGKGGRALERIKQDRRSRGLDAPEVENPAPSGELPLRDEESDEETEETDDG